MGKMTTPEEAQLALLTELAEEQHETLRTAATTACLCPLFLGLAAYFGWGEREVLIALAAVLLVVSVAVWVRAWAELARTRGRIARTQAALPRYRAFGETLRA